VDGADKTLSSIFTAKLTRVAGDASDTYTGDALLKEFDIHYQIDAMGSRQEFIK